MFRIIILFCFSLLFYCANSNAGAMFCIGGGYPMGLINNVNSPMQKFANDYGGSMDKSASGGTFLVDLTFLSQPKDSTSTILFGLLTGYSYNGTDEASATVPGIQDQRINIKWKANIHEIKAEPGIFIAPANSSLRIFLGGGALYSVVNFKETASDNDSHHGVISGPLASGLGLVGIGKIMISVDGNKAIGIQAEVTDKNFTIGAYIAGIGL
jgi:hypothetical protein